MKKKIRAVMMVAAVALIAGINVFNSQKTIAMSDIALANVEALADDEGNGTPCCNQCNGAFCGTFYPASNPTERVSVYYL